LWAARTGKSRNNEVFLGAYSYQCGAERGDRGILVSTWTAVQNALDRVRKGVRARVRMGWDARFGELPQPGAWVFIVGCTNSGTSLLHDVLSGHEATGQMPVDGHFIQTQLPTPWGHGLQRVWGTRPDIFRMTEESPSEARARRLKRQWGARYDDPKRPILLEKTPPNALRMPWLNRYFENAHFVGIVRHPFAVTEGIHRKSGWPYELAARQWRMTNEMMLEDAERLPRWMLVRYEDLTERTDEVVEEVAAFIGLEAEGIDTERASWEIGGVDRKIRNMNDRSLERLSEEDRQTILREAGPLMERFGYSVEPVDE
jgi:hypothetical protein